jgi:hypothetical protein
VVTDDPLVTLPVDGPMIRTQPVELNGHYTFDRDCSIRPAAECLKNSIIRQLFPREST